MTVSREKLGLLLGFIAMCLFAGTLPATRLAMSGLDPLFLTAARGVIAGSTGLIVLLIIRRRLPSQSVWPQMFAAASCSVLGFPLLAALAMKTVPAAHGGVVQGILPLATAVAAVIFAHERPSREFWLASVGGATIVLIFVFRRNDGGAISVGDIFLIGTVIVGALGYTFAGRLSALMPAWEVISWQVVLFLPIAALATFALWPAGIESVSPASWASLGYVGFVSQYTAFLILNMAMGMVGIARVGQVMLLQPFVIVGLAWPMNGEPIDIETVVFAAAVVVVVLFGQWQRAARRGDRRSGQQG